MRKTLPFILSCAFLLPGCSKKADSKTVVRSEIKERYEGSYEGFEVIINKIGEIGNQEGKAYKAHSFTGFMYSTKRNPQFREIHGIDANGDGRWDYIKYFKDDDYGLKSQKLSETAKAKELLDKATVAIKNKEHYIPKKKGDKVQFSANGDIAGIEKDYEGY